VQEPAVSLVAIRTRLAAALLAAVAMPVAAAPGVLDCSFATNGVLTADLGGTEAAHDAALTASGALLILNSDLRVTRITPAGAVDTSFGTAGSVTPIIPGSPSAFDLAVDSQGRILIAGGRTDGDNEVFVARLTSAGVLDTSFGGGDGWIGFDWSADTASGGIDRVGDLLVASGDRPVVIGSYDANGNIFNPSNANIAVARLTDSGVLDASFGVGGIGVASSPGSVDDDARGGAIDADGRILTIGAWSPSSGPRNTIVTRWNANGTLDTSFGTGGVLVSDLSTTNIDDFGISMAIDGSNRAMLLSSTGDDPTIARLTEAGTLDTSFGTGGIVQRSFVGGQDVTERILVQSDGRILVTGWPVVGGTFRFASMRFTSAGVLDTSWGGTGVVTTVVGGNMRAYSAVLTANGRLVMAGGLNNDTQIVLARYLTDSGSLLVPTLSFTAQTPNPSLRTDPVSFTVSVSAGATPSGSVLIGDGVDGCTATLAASGVGVASGSCSIAFSTAGTRTVTADYNGGGALCRATQSVQQQVRFRVTPSAGAGGVITPGTVQGAAPGTTVAFNLQPASGFTVRGATGCGGTRNGNIYTTGPINADCSVAATFNAIPQAQAGTLNLLEDAGATAGQLVAIDDGDPLTYSISTAPTRGSVAITNAATGAYTYTPNPDANGNDSFQFRVSDGSGLSAPATVNVTITPVNDAPTLSVGANIDHPAGTVGAQSRAGYFGFDAGPPDEDATQMVQDYSFNPVVDPAGVLVAGSLGGALDGTLTYQLSGRAGTAVVDVRVFDTGGIENGGVNQSAPRQFTITVAPGTDLEVAIDDGRSLVQDGESTIYAIVVANAGPNDATATLATTLPPALTDVAWTCVQASSTATCPTPTSGTGSLSTGVTLAVGTALRFDLIATVDGTIGDTITAAAGVTLPAGVTALDPGDDTDTDTNAIVGNGVFGDGFEGSGLSVPAGLRALADPE
jgi:uncharacterized delta-60 repeat protein